MIFSVISMPVNIDKKANMNRVNVIILSRLILSANTPPHIEKINIGPEPEKVKIPSIRFEFPEEQVNSCINQSLPDIRAHTPKFENSAPSQNNLYSLDLNTVKISYLFFIKE